MVLDGTGSRFKETVRMSFEKARSDILKNSSKIDSIVDKFDLLMSEIKAIRKENAELRSEVEKLRKVPSSSKAHPLVSDGTSTKKTGTRAEKELIKQFRLNRRQIIQKRVKELLVKGQISVYEAYVDIVEKEGLCSKTSFYRYVKDFEAKKEVKVSLIDGTRFLSSK